MASSERAVHDTRRPFLSDPADWAKRAALAARFRPGKSRESQLRRSPTDTPASTALIVIDETGGQMSHLLPRPFATGAGHG